MSYILLGGDAAGGPWTSPTIVAILADILQNMV